MSDRKPRRPQPDDDWDDDAPVRKKKKKHRSHWPMVRRYGIVAAGVLGLVLVIWGITRIGGGAPAQAVTAWERFDTEENEFGFVYPAGWKAKGYGLKGRREVEVTGPSASINVKENLTGSLVGDIAGALNQGKPVPDELLPVSKVHEMRQPKDTRSYQEEPPVTVMTKFGKARRSEYKDGPKRGYRVTVLLHQTALDIYCECRASDWETLRPAFDRVIDSLGRGG